MDDPDPLYDAVVGTGHSVLEVELLIPWDRARVVAALGTVGIRLVRERHDRAAA